MKDVGQAVMQAREGFLGVLHRMIYLHVVHVFYPINRTVCSFIKIIYQSIASMHLQ